MTESLIDIKEIYTKAECLWLIENCKIIRSIIRNHAAPDVVLAKTWASVSGWIDDDCKENALRHLSEAIAAMEYGGKAPQADASISAGEVLSSQQADVETPASPASDDVYAMRRAMHRSILGDASTRKDEGVAETANETASHPSEISMVNKDFIIEHIWRLFDQFQSPLIGNRSPKAEESAKIMAKRVFERLAPYLRTTEPVSGEFKSDGIARAVAAMGKIMSIDERALEASREKAFNELGIDRNYAVQIIEAYEAAKVADQPVDMSEAEQVAKAIYLKTSRKGLLWPRVFSWDEYPEKDIYFAEAKAAIEAMKREVVEALEILDRVRKRCFVGSPFEELQDPLDKIYWLLKGVEQ